MTEADKGIRASDFADWWEHHAAAHPHRLALADSERRLTWQEAAHTARRLSHALLTLGLNPEDIVASWLPNWVESYVLRVACERAGLAWLPIPASLREHEAKTILEHADARVLFVAGKWGRTNFADVACVMHADLPHLEYLIGVRVNAPNEFLSWERLLQAEETHSPQPRNPGPLILPTSGSTGMPKFAYFSAPSWLLRGQIQAEIFRLQPDDVLLAMARGIGPSIPPLFAAPVTGSSTILMERLEAEEILALLEQEKVTVVCGVPAQLATIIYHQAWDPPRTRTVRLWYTTGAPMPADLAEKVEKETCGIVLCGYGGMDFGGWAVPSLDDPPEIRHRTVGIPLVALRSDWSMRRVGTLLLVRSEKFWAEDLVAPAATTETNRAHGKNGRMTAGF